MDCVDDVIFTVRNPPDVIGLHPRDETFAKATGQSIVLTTGTCIVYTCTCIVVMNGFKGKLNKL